MENALQCMGYTALVVYISLHSAHVENNMRYYRDSTNSDSSLIS